jgi:DUF971 family protein
MQIYAAGLALHGVQDMSRWPTQLTLSQDKRSLTIAFEDGSSHVLAAEYLRVMSPSAEVQGHTAEQRQTVPGKKEVTIVALELVGHYAIRIVFDDRHDTGLYAWDYLDRLGQDYESRWQAYLDELAEKGMSREPKFPRF